MTYDQSLSIHHVGGRGGSRRLPDLLRFERDVVNVLFEADSSAVTGMEEATASLASRQIVVDRCIGSGRGKVTFRILWNPAASSYLPIASRFREDYPFLTEDVLDYDPTAWDATSVTELETVSLDDVVLSERLAPAPDFLSINTQGSELDILRGSQRLLSENAIAVQVEVSFAEIYQEQGSLDGIAAQLAGAGFRLYQLMQHGVRGHGFSLGGDIVRTPIGLRGGGAAIQADALFVKEPRFIMEKHPEPVLGLVKGVFLGFVLKYFDYAYACGAAIKKLNGLARLDGSDFEYVGFVRDYLKAMDAYPQLFPPTWTDIFEKSTGARTEPGVARAKYFSTVEGEGFRRAVSFLTEPEFVGVELVASNHGFKSHAEELRHQRLASIWNGMRYLGLVDDQPDGAIELHLDRI